MIRTITIDTEFYTYTQNNSGGSFIQDIENGVGQYVIMEALNNDDAVAKMNKLAQKVSGFFSYCGCCGERWSLDYPDIHDEPKIYNNPAKTYASMYSDDETGYIHYYDGKIETLDIKRKIKYDN